LFGIGLPEFLLIIAVGIIVISPDDIPHALHTMGKFFNKFKTITRDVQRSIDDVIAVDELEEITREANKAGNININMEELERQQVAFRTKNISKKNEEIVEIKESSENAKLEDLNDEEELAVKLEKTA